MTEIQLEYDKKKPGSIEEYSQKLINKTFGDVYEDYLKRHGITGESLNEAITQFENKKRKGGLGEIIEKYFFEYEPNSSPEPDFPEAGVELKVSPYRINKKTGEISAKERLVLTMIDYDTVYKETFFESHFWHKANLLLLVYYLYEQEITNRLAYPIHYSKLFSPPDEDLSTIISDFKKIVEMIKAGKAHEISCSNTVYLEACPKASNSSITRTQPFSDEPAKPRAFAFKNAYMTYVLNTYIVPNKPKYESIYQKAIGNYTISINPANQTTAADGTATYQREHIFNIKPLEEFVTEKIQKYIGYSVEQLCSEFDVKFNKKPKNLESMLVFRILGIGGNNAEEFVKANIVVKTIRISLNGKIKESMSFPTFKFKELILEDWDESTFGNYLRDTRFLFVVYRAEENYLDKKHPIYRLIGCQFWNMPYDDLEENVRKVWLKTKFVLQDGLILEEKGNKITNNLPKASENPVCHVRPHGQNRDDAYELPDGRFYQKQCFWLNNTYIQSQLKKEFFD
ncbi:MAG TPA: MutH/Sau3AI family endonuclease [Methanocorpusculum sp.]|nr:MutH/Sau3AI family endonuclease [Methanocorpusculum sp.]